MRSVAILVMLGACAAPSPTRPQRPLRLASPVSPSTHVDYHDVPLVVVAGLGRDGEWTARTSVEAVRPHPAGTPGWWQVVLAGADPEAARTLTIYAAAAMKLATGDRVGLRFRRVRVGGIAYDEAIEVFDDHQQLLAATFTGSATITD